VGIGEVETADGVEIASWELEVVDPLIDRHCRLATSYPVASATVNL
jgi:hypothetical protein